MRKYGIAYRRIQFFQNEAVSVYRMNGCYVGRYELEHMINRASAQNIGHAAIALAAVASPEHVIAVLNGSSRGHRWTV